MCLKSRNTILYKTSFIKDSTIYAKKKNKTNGALWKNFDLLRLDQCKFIPSRLTSLVFCMTPLLLR